MAKNCELCGRNSSDNEMIFGVWLCPECSMHFNNAMKDDPQARAYFSNMQNFPNATNKAIKEIFSLVSYKSAEEYAQAQAYPNQNTQYYQAPPQPNVNYSAPTYTAPSKSQDGFLDGLYSDIGKKIKNWAKWIFIVEAISSVIGAFAMIFTEEDVLVAIGFAMIFVGPLVAWVSSRILYAFGELVEKTVDNEQHTREILKIISEMNHN